MAPAWTSIDDARLRELYVAGLSLRDIGQQVGRSSRAVDDRRRTLGIGPRRHVPRWTTIEDGLLRAAAAAGIPDSQIASRLARPVAQVQARRHRIVGPRAAGRPYSVAEDERLRACWTGDGDIRAVARELRRSVASLRLRAQVLGLHRPEPRPRWRPDEDAVLRDGYEQALSCAQIAAQLPGRSTGAIAARAAKLGLATYARLWTPLDDRRLRVLSTEGRSIETIAQALGRTPQALVQRARRLDITLPRPSVARRSGRRWTPPEDEVLRINGALNPAVLAGVLGRSPSAVAQRLRRLGVSTERSPHHPVARRGTLTPGERATAIRELRAGGPLRVFSVAHRLDAPLDVLRAVAAAAPFDEPRTGPEQALELRASTGSR